MPVRLGDPCPHEHRALRFLDLPPHAIETIDEDVPPPLVDVNHFMYVVVALVQGDDRCDLDRLERAVVEIRLQLGQCRDHLRVPDHEADSPARHRMALRQGVQLDANILGSWNLEHARGYIVVVCDVGVREVVNEHRVVLFRERHETFEEVDVDRRRRRIVRKRGHDHARPGPGVVVRLGESFEEIDPGREMHTLNLGPRQDGGVDVDRIRRFGNQRHVSGLNERPHEMRQPFLRPDGVDDLGLGIEFHSVAAQVAIGDRLPEVRDAARRRVPVVLLVLRRLDEFVDDERR